MARTRILERDGFRMGQRVFLKQPTMGGTDEDDEVVYPAGSPGLIADIEDLGGKQGVSFTVSIGEITNNFDQGDGPIGNFLSATPVLPAFAALIGLTPKQVADTICTAVEGGISYWARGFHLVSPDEGALKERPWYASAALYDGPFTIKVVQVDEHKEGAGCDVFLTPDSIRRGLAWLAANKPERIGEIIGETGDACTADDFIQACVFGELIYG